ncbi:hypothetical protein BZU93_26805 [Salmonella enterica subsp. enterica]|nr:hypothetical protein [Salmonella enterica subsp. enterica serovar Enteritidis]
MREVSVSLRRPGRNAGAQRGHGKAVGKRDLGTVNAIAFACQQLGIDPKLLGRDRDLLLVEAHPLEPDGNIGLSEL